MGILDKVIGIVRDKDKKSKVDFSDVKSGSSSTTPANAPAGSSSGGSPRSYTVVSGDSLSKIAKREYGDAAKWPLIYQANRDKIQNPDLIHPGQVLTLPRDG